MERWASAALAIPAVPSPPPRPRASPPVPPSESDLLLAHGLLDRWGAGLNEDEHRQILTCAHMERRLALVDQLRARGAVLPARWLLVQTLRSAEPDLASAPRLMDVCLDTVVALQERVEVEASIGLVQAIEAWLQRSGRELELMRKKRALRWALLQELVRLPTWFSSRARKRVVFALETDSWGDLWRHFEAWRQAGSAQGMQDRRALREHAPQLDRLLEGWKEQQDTRLRESKRRRPTRDSSHEPWGAFRLLWLLVLVVPAALHRCSQELPSRPKSSRPAKDEVVMVLEGPSTDVSELPSQPPEPQQLTEADLDDMRTLISQSCQRPGLLSYEACELAGIVVSALNQGACLEARSGIASLHERGQGQSPLVLVLEHGLGLCKAEEGAQQTRSP